jgi:hypothetical protein
MKLWVFINKVILYLWFVTRLQKLKTLIYRFIWERQYVKSTVIVPATSLKELASRIKPDWWRADSWKQLFDAVSTPEYVQWVWLHGPQDSGFDCDEYAVYITAVINDSLKKGLLNEVGIKRAWMTTICWVTEAGGVYGHNVSVLEYNFGGKETYFYMDYGMPSGPFNSLRDLAEAVVKLYGGKYLTIIAKQNINLGLHELIFP